MIFLYLLIWIIAFFIVNLFLVYTMIHCTDCEVKDTFNSQITIYSLTIIVGLTIAIVLWLEYKAH